MQIKENVLILGGKLENKPVFVARITVFLKKIKTLRIKGGCGFVKWDCVFGLLTEGIVKQTCP